MPTANTIQTPKDPWHRAWAWLLVLLVLLTLGARFAEPVRDGDLWWQMAYGRYLIEHSTLIPDHTVFTWTPSQTTTIYCAWVSEIFLYLLHQMGGLPALFSFRYLCLLVFVFAVWLQARRLRIAGHPMTWLICLLGLLMSQSAAFIKPEIFSYVLMTTTVMVWWHIKSSGDAGWRYCYLFPVLMVIWVNSHGGFMFGAVFLFVMGVGEALNILFSPSEALVPRIRRHLFIGLFLSALAVFVTPYGWHYPAYLIPNVLLAKGMAGFRTIRAYTSVFEDRVALYHYVDYLLLAGLILIALMWHKLKRRRPDWALILTNLSFAFLYTRFLRTTYYWAPIFSLSALHLLANKAGWPWPKRRTAVLCMGGAIAVVCVLLAGRAAFDAVCRPYGTRWFGFGISYQNPVEEAAFIQANLPIDRLGNDYSCGGYLLWALEPEIKVMIDPRQFPFREWYAEYREFSTGRNVGGFVRRSPCDVWCIRYEHERVTGWFLRSADWKLAFYGASAAVFVRNNMSLSYEAPRAGRGIGEIKNMGQALMVLAFAASIQDWNSARKIVDSMQERFKCPEHRSPVQAAGHFLEGTRAYFQRDYEKGIKHLEACHRSKAIRAEALLVNCYNHLTVLAWSNRDDQRALSAAESALVLKPTDAYALFNAGVTEWYLREKTNAWAKTTSPHDWKSGGLYPLQTRPLWGQRLRMFLKLAKSTPGMSESAVGIAQSILNGSYNMRPPLARPAEPRLLRSEKGRPEGDVLQ